MKKYFLLLFSVLYFSFTCFSQEVNSKAIAVNEAIIQEGRVVNEAGLWQENATDLPIGIKREIAGQEYIIGIDSLVFTPGGSYISATAVVDVPGTEEKIAFSGSKINITPNGFKGASSAKLHLASDIPVRLNNKVKLTFKGTENKTYLEFNCNGMLGMGIQGEFEFCREFLIPELPDGKIAPEPHRVKAQFETEVSEMGNILAKVSITPFQVPSLKGFGFYVQDAWVDQSDLNNPGAMVFPRDYQSPYFIDGNYNMWRGFFLRQVAVKLPSQFNEKGKNERKEISASNLLIDNMGVSGWFTGKNVLPINEGNMSGWPFSVDEISVGITANTLTGAGFKGTLTMPLAKEDKKLQYTAIIESGNNYLFSVATTETLEVPLWGATMNLHPPTALEVAYRDDTFLPKATLHGNLSLTPDLGNGGDKGEFKGIRFENLIVQADSPHIIPGTFSIESRDNKMAGFKFTINEIGIVNKENFTGLHVNLSLHLMNDTDGGFSGQTGITVFGKMEATSLGEQKWKYDHLHLDKVKIDVKGGAYEISGELNIYRKNLTYGSGFKGIVDAKFLPGLAVRATAQFGNINDMRYWYVDALAKIPSGISITPGFGLYGFGGGLYHHMRRKDLNVDLDKAPVSSEVAGSVQATEVVEMSPPPSGITYVPDSRTFLGLKATVIIGTYPSSEAFNADATFEIAFNENAGVNYVSFYGSGYFMTSIEKRKDNVPVKADVNVSMDFVNEVMHGNFEVYVNVAGTLRGVHPGNLAGGAVMHFEKNNWYIHIGTPDKRLGLNFAGIFNADCYFMVGTEMPSMPEPPENVKHILGGADLNFMRDENTLSRGGGFCFGGSVNVNTGKKQFMFFYGQFSAGAGFDIMLKNYGKDVQCKGRSGALGINGWYASGQAYAYIQGEIGIKVDLPIVQGDFKIMELGAAVVLQAKLPNPTFLAGHVGGYYSIFNGKVKGNCNFKLTIGEECEIVGGSVVSGIKVISEVTPRTGETKVNVFSNPQAAFTLEVDKVMELEDLDGQIKSFRVKLGDFKLTQGSTEIPGTITWNEAMDVAAFNSTDILPANSTVKATVRVYFEEKVNGQWKPVLVNGKPAEEISETSFTTGEAPDFIPVSNVQYSYPAINQFHFHKNEYSNGYIQLKKGQDDLFVADSKWRRKGRFVLAGNTTGSITDITYNTSENTVQFSIPHSLENDKIYLFELVNIPAEENAMVDANVKNVDNDLTEDGSVIVESKEIEGNYVTLEEKVFYSAGFKTSKYSSFIEKMNSIEKSEGWLVPIIEYVGLYEQGISFSGDEMFDKYEISGDEFIKPLIQFEAKLNNSWYERKVYPLVYREYPLNGNITITNRDINQLGLPPVRAIDIRQENNEKLLTETEIATGYASPVATYSTMVYKLSFWMYQDYADLKQKASYLITPKGYPTGAAYNLLYTSFPPVTSGKYEVEAGYLLPGINKVTSTYKLVIKNQ